MRMTRDIIISLFFGLIIALLTSCGSDDKSAEELKNAYLKKEAEETAARKKQERVRRGQLTFAEAISAMYERNELKTNFNDIIRFYDQGHYYKGFYTVYRQGTRRQTSTAGIVHDPNCPCSKNKLR